MRRDKSGTEREKKQKKKKNKKSTKREGVVLQDTICHPFSFKLNTMPKEGDIVVRTDNRARTSHKIGTIYKVVREHHRCAYYESGASMENGHWRFANASEINAYNQGCRHIEKIKELSYEIY